MTMDEYIIKFLRDKFHLNKIFKRNLEQTIMSIINYSAEDIRIDNMRRFMGLSGEEPLRIQILDCFLILLKNLPISFFKLFDIIEFSQTLLISIEAGIEIYSSKFQNYFIGLVSFEKIIRETKIYKNEVLLEEMSIDRKKDVFFLTRYYQKSAAHFENLVKDFKDNNKNEENAIKIAEHIILSNKEYELNLIDCLNILKRNFNLPNDFLSLELFLSFFLDRYSMKIKILEFVQISLETFIVIYTDLEQKISKIWNRIEVERKGIIFYKEFEVILLDLLKSNENVWKFQEYFK